MVKSELSWVMTFPFVRRLKSSCPTVPERGNTLLDRFVAQYRPSSSIARRRWYAVGKEMRVGVFNPRHDQVAGLIDGRVARGMTRFAEGARRSTFPTVLTRSV